MQQRKNHIRKGSKGLIIIVSKWWNDEDFNFLSLYSHDMLFFLYSK